jgi:flagellar FliL protein
MAIELELPELTPGEEAPPPPPRAAALSVKQTILATLVVTVMAVAMGALFAVPPPAPEPVVKADASAPGAPGAPAAGPTDLFEMPPIVTNLGAPKDTWIRLEASIVFDAKAIPHPETLADEIASDELAYLRTVSLSQIEGPIGLQNIRQDLNERAAIRSNGKVSELIIRTLVVQ